MIPLQITIKTYLENKTSQIPTDLNSESKQIKNLLKSEKMKRTEITPSSPRQLYEVLATSPNPEANRLLIDNSKIFKFGNFPTNKESYTEKTLRESILNINTEENKNKNKVVNTIPNNYSESSVYYEHNNKVIEEYNNNLNMVKEENEDESEDKVPKQDKTYKYFSNLNV